MKRTTQAAKRDFDAAHGDGMEALKRGDYEAFGDAVKREREAIESMPVPKKRKPKKR